MKINNLSLGDFLTESYIDEMAVATKPAIFRNSDVIIMEGEVGSTFYMIERGVVDIFISDRCKQPVRTLGTGDFFGEQVLFEDNVRSSSCITSSDCRCLCLDREDFALMLGDLKQLLEDSYTGRNLFRVKFKKIIDSMKNFNIIFKWHT